MFLALALIGAAVEGTRTWVRWRREQRTRLEQHRHRARVLASRGYDVTPPHLITSTRQSVLRDTEWNRTLRAVDASGERADRAMRLS